MSHRTTPAQADPPKPSDPPFLMAVLIGAMRTDDRLTATLAREWLADLGIRVQIAKNAPILVPRFTPELTSRAN